MFPKIISALKKCRETIILAAESQSKFYSATVLVCGFIFAIGLSFVVKPKFEFQGNLDVVSWITVSKYPKQQELFYYLSSLFFIPSLTIAIWGLWLLCSKLVSYVTGLPLHHTLKKYALTYLPFILILKNISTPTFSKMLLIPLILVPVIKTIFLIHDLSRTRFSRLRNAIFYSGSSNLHWSAFTSGICAGFFVLIGYSEYTKELFCIKIIGLSAIITWLFWLVYSKILSAITKRSFNDVLASDIFSNFLLVTLLLVSLFPGHKTAVLVISTASVILIKILNIIKPEWIKRLVHLHKYILEYALIPALIYVTFYSGGNIHGGIDMFHEGERLAPLSELLRGDIPYRDIYLQHGLFYNAYRPLLAAKLFGPTLAADRLLGHILDPLGHVAFYILALQIFRSKLSAFLLIWVLASGVSQDFVFWNSAQRMVYTPGRLAPAYLSIAILAVYSLSQHRQIIYKFHLLPVLTGVCSTIAIFYSLEIGLYTATACFLFLLIRGITSRDRFSPLLSYLAGILAAFLPIAVYFLSYGALDDLVRNSYIQTRYQNPTWGLRFPPLFPELSKVKSLESLKAFILSDTFRWYSPILTYILALTYLAYQALRSRLWNTKSNIIILLTTISGIVFFRTMLGRSDGTHLYGMSFAWIIGMFLIECLIINLWKELKMDFSVSVSWHSHVPMSTRPHPISAAALRAGIILLLFWYATSVYKPVDTARQLSLILTGYQSIERDVEPPLDRAGGIKIPADQASQIKAVVNYIQSNTNPDETIFDFSNQGAYYFFADRPMATRYHMVCYAATEALQREVIEDLERNRPELALFSNSSWMDSIDGVPNVNRHQLIAEYLKEKYVESAKIGPTIFWKRYAVANSK